MRNVAIASPVALKLGCRCVEDTSDYELEKHAESDVHVRLLNFGQSIPRSPEYARATQRSRQRYAANRASRGHEGSLLVADTTQLHEVGLKESDTERKVDTHDPKLCAAQEVPIGGVCQ